MIKSRTPLIFEATRGVLIESVHEVVCVVADKRGHVLGHAGNMDYVITPRSSIKLLQAVPLLESGAYDHFKLNEKHLVLACASHKGQKHHIEALKEWLGLIQRDESILACGPEGGSTSKLSHNCSGKHLGMITSAIKLKIDPVHYDKFEHPYQEFLRKYLTEISGIDFLKAPHGIDGCCIPTYGMSIQKFAIAMAAFVADEGATPRTRLYKQILAAIVKYPQYLGGENDFTHHVIESTQGRAIVKTGAEGAYVGLMPAQGLAFALKVVDGNSRAAEVACMQIFKQYGALQGPDLEKLKDYLEPAVKNSRGEKVGVIRLRPQGA